MSLHTGSGAVQSVVTGLTELSVMTETTELTAVHLHYLQYMYPDKLLSAVIPAVKQAVYYLVNVPVHYYTLAEPVV